MRKAMDHKGSEITWHMFFINKNQEPMAIVDYGSKVDIIPATWVNFTEPASYLACSNCQLLYILHGLKGDT